MGTVDLRARCAALRLPAPGADGALRIEMLGRTLVFAGPDWQGHVVGSGRAHPVDRLLFLRYLTCDAPLRPTGRRISFREFPGGQFYWGPFRLRAVQPLLRQIGNDVELLRSRLARYHWEPMALGDLAGRVRVFGRAEVGLVYRRGDDDLPAELDILFDSSLKRVYGAEDAAALAGRVCSGLCCKACRPCLDCGLCDTAAQGMRQGEQDHGNPSGPIGG